MGTQRKAATAVSEHHHQLGLVTPTLLADHAPERMPMRLLPVLDVE
jgi:hypothetical protein